MHKRIILSAWCLNSGCTLIRPQWESERRPPERAGWPGHRCLRSGRCDCADPSISFLRASVSSAWGRAVQGVCFLLRLSGSPGGVQRAGSTGRFCRQPHQRHAVLEGILSVQRWQRLSDGLCQRVPCRDAGPFLAGGELRLLCLPLGFVGTSAFPATGSS